MGQPPIDQGYAWVACLGSGMCMFFVVGGLRSLGILFVEFLALFGGTSGQTAWMMGLIAAGMSVCAPIANALGARYSYRAVVMIGGSMCAVAAFLTAFAMNIQYVIIVFGLFTGIGYGCIFGPGLVVVGMYFNKRRSLANGLAMAGGSIGQLSLPMLMRYLLDTYDFKGGLWIYAGVCLNVIVAGALLRPFSFYTSKGNGKNDQIKTSVADKGNLQQEQGGEGETPQETDGSVQENGAAVNGSLDKDKAIKEGDGEPLVEQEPRYRSRSSLHKSSTALSKSQQSLNNVKSKSHHGSMSSLMFQDPPGQTSQSMSNNMTNQQSENVPKPNRCQKIVALFCPCFLRTKYPGIVPLFEWSLLKNYLFIIYVIGVCLGNSGYVNLCLFIPPYAQDLGFDKHKAAMLLSIVGLCDLVGRVSGGWFADLGYIKRSNLMFITISFTGVVAIICANIQTFWACVVLAVVLGLVGGFYVSLLAVILVDFLGLAKLSSAFGLSVMFIGLTNIPIPTMLGVSRDVTGSYVLALSICGAMMVLGGISFALEPIARKAQNKKDGIEDSPADDGKDNADVENDDKRIQETNNEIKDQTTRNGNTQDVV